MEEKRVSKKTAYYWFLAALVIFGTIFLNLFIGEWKIWLFIMQVVAILLFIWEGILNLVQYRENRKGNRRESVKRD